MVNKSVFWQALLFTIFVFGAGLLSGVLLEDSRTEKVSAELADSEISILDEQVRNDIFDRFDVDCNDAIDSTFTFADKIYDEASSLGDYQSAAKLGTDFDSVQRRYDLLRMMLWAESIELKERCGEDFHTVVYFYEFNSDDTDKEALQNAFSRLTFDLKQNHGADVLLIPIAGNTNLVSVDVVLSTYSAELPVIIVDEEIVIRELVTLGELESIVFEE